MPAFYNPKYGAIYGGAYGMGTGIGFFNQNAPNNGVVIFSQSNAGEAFCVATAMTGYPNIANPYSNVKITRRGAVLADPPVWVTEGPVDLQPRTVQVNAGAYAVGTGGCTLSLGRALDTTGPTNTYRLMQMFIDGSGWENNWDNPAYPTGGPPLFTQLCNEIRTQLVAMNAHLEMIFIVGGVADGGESPDFIDSQAHLTNLINGLRAQFGPAKAVISLVGWSSGAMKSEVISGCYETALNMANVGVIKTSNLVYRVDGVHYDPVGGQGELGDKASAKYFELKNGTVPANPRVVGVGVAVTGSSAQGVSPVPPTHEVNDVLLLIHSGNGNTAYGTPSGWNLFTNSPQHNGASGVNARLTVWWQRASGHNAIGTPTVADNAGDGGKEAFIINVRGCKTSGNPFVTDAGAVAATSTSVSFPTVDTTGTNNCLILNILSATLTTNGAKASAVVNAGLTTLEREIDWFSTVSAAGIVCISGVKVTGGAVAATTCTLSATADQALETIALSP